jgi:hypothetical protein
MNDLQIQLQGDNHFAPGDRVSGLVHWQLDFPPNSAELRLLWYTQGKGTQDLQVIDVAKFDGATQSGDYEFEFTLPAGPYSYSGKLISILWTLELLIEPKSLSTRSDFTMGPDRREVVMQTLAEQTTS